MCLQGLIGGFGASLILLPSNVAPNYYFEEKRSLASGIARMGKELLYAGAYNILERSSNSPENLVV